MRINKTLLAVAIGAAFFSLKVNAQIQNAEVYEFPGMNQQNCRQLINIPDIKGYQTLKCDFHIHTVFSDGQEWPSMRVNEAWNDGLDAIAITDHIEYRPNKDIVVSDFNKSYEIAKRAGDGIDMIVIQGTEITRKKPFGHMNALFIQDANKIDVPNELDAVDEAVKQGAFILWNHPGWPNDTSTFYPVQKKLISEKKLHGAEVFNAWEYYPKVIDWCKDKNLAYFANSDIHYTSGNIYRGEFRRPMTLVFAKERSVEGIKEALFAGRTVACFNNILAGKEEYLKELIKNSLFVKVINKAKNTVELSNKSDIAFQIKYGTLMYSIAVKPNQAIRINLPAGGDVTFTNCMIGQDKYVVTKLW
jgi:predicted metal-dependent phosphoesterase TrpH